MKRSRTSSEDRPAKRSRGWWPFSSATVEEEEEVPKTLVETIAASNVGKFQDALKPILKALGLTGQLKLPTIVFCGQENSGKSSTVERAAMIPFTPRATGICTRQPLYLECKHTVGKDALVLHTTKGKETIPISSMDDGTLEQHVKEVMFQGPGIDERPIKLSYTSSKVPTMSFCDLPGTVGVTKTGEPTDMKEQTVELLEETISDQHSLIVAVVTADVRNNIALDILQKTPGALGRAIVVLAKTDTMKDNAYKSKGKKSPYWQIDDMMTSTPIDGYTGKIYPVVNRDSTLKKKRTLVDINTREQQWFKKNLPYYNRESQCSINSVINAIDALYSKHMRTVWIPMMMATIATKKAMTEHDMKQLGVAPPGLDRHAMWLWFQERLKTHCQHVMAVHCQESNTETLKVCGAVTLKTSSHTGMIKVAEERQHMFQSLRDYVPSLAAHHVRRYMSVVEKAFATPHADYRIARFRDMHHQCQTLLKRVLKKASKRYQTEWASTLQTFELSVLGKPTVPIAEIGAAELHVSLRCFAIPMEQWFTAKTVFQHEFIDPKTLVEDCADKRRDFQDTLKAFDEATSKLAVLRATS